MKNATLKLQGLAETELLKQRLDNIQQFIVSFLKQLPIEEQQELLTLPDDAFWSEARFKARVQQVITTTTQEKTEQEEFAENRLAFMEHLQAYGGVHKTSAVEKLIHASVPTVIKYGEKNKLLVLNWGAENLYPVFQFSTDEIHSEKGMLKGVPKLLAAMQHNISTVRKCNFFTHQREMPASAEMTSILAVLQRGATPEEMAFFMILAENLGTQNAV